MGETTFKRLDNAALEVISNRWQGAERGPYLIVTDPDKVCENWMVANLGAGADGNDVWLTTDHIPGSELRSTPESQAEFFAHAQPDMQTLGKALTAAYEEIDRLTGQRIWQRWWEPRKRRLLSWWHWDVMRKVREIHWNPFAGGGFVRRLVAQRLHMRHDTCTSSVVIWELGHGSFWEYRDLIGAAGACEDEGKTGSCYCGKFAKPEAAPSTATVD